MRWRFLLIAGLAWLACSCGSKLKTELEGTWSALSADRDASMTKGPGKNMKKAQSKDMKKAQSKDLTKGLSPEMVAKMKMNFRENHFTMTSDGNVMSEGWFSLNASASPRKIEILHGNKVTAGIYKIERDQLTICLAMGADAGQPPSDFSSPPPAGCILFVLKRESR
jgi:uncharacterized protein (TIGR03067 family)